MTALSRLTPGFMCCSHDVVSTCQLYVLPLAHESNDSLSFWRWPGEPHMRALAQVMDIQFVVHDVADDLITTEFGDVWSASGFTFDLVYDGSHYELLYR